MVERRPPFLLLSPVLQTYAWGKRGSSSEAAQLKYHGDKNFVIDDNQTYAELWMGTHKKAPATIACPDDLDGTLLSDWLQVNQWALGDSVATEFNGGLPFLFKVLSIDQALSIQAHPNKPHACELHRKAPDKYPDPNHKPEMVVALTEFEGLCGFRSPDSVKEWASQVPEFRTVLGQEAADILTGLRGNATLSEQLAVMKTSFTALMSADSDLVSEQLVCFKKRMEEAVENGEKQLCREESLVMSLHQLHHGDVGCFCVFFLNHVQLSPGEAMFLGPNEPHCYIKGDVVECMACSDNVVRAGLTKKFKDKTTLCQMLTYTPTPADGIKLQPYRAPGSSVDIYDPPTPEFAVARVVVSGKEAEEFCVAAVNGPSILLIIHGSATMAVCGSSQHVDRGSVVFLPAGHRADLCCSALHQIVLFRAYCEL